MATLICGPPKKVKDKNGEKMEDLEYNGDPKSVEHLSAAERQAMTDRLMGKFRGMGGMGAGLKAGDAKNG